jgi:hypothetical protein
VKVQAPLHYNPQIISPVGIDDSSVSASLDGPSHARVDQRQGIISYEADFTQPRTDSLLIVAKIKWKALQPAESTPIKFVNNENYTSGVFGKDAENLLHDRGDAASDVSDQTGLLDATVAVDPTDASIQRVEEGGNAFSAVALASNISAGTADGGIQISLSPRRANVSPGESFLVDVNYSNPRRADIDTVSLRIHFDPSVLQVEDYDNGNWITRGINIFDGDYHENLPFDFHRKNDAYNGTGLITYEMGLSTRTVLPQQGTIATIRFKAIAPSNATPIDFDMSESPSEADNTTAISFLGFNLIGTPGQRQQAVHNATVSVTGSGS